MNKKLLLEIIPFTLFLIFGIFTFFKIRVPYAALVTMISGAFLAMIYFYASFWLFSTVSIPTVTKVVVGLVYSMSILACLFCLLHWPLWKLYSIISYIGLGIFLVISLFNQKSLAYKPILYRCLLLLVFVSVIFGYRYFSA
jgi:hypothetical protein